MTASPSDSASYLMTIMDTFNLLILGGSLSVNKTLTPQSAR